MSAVEPLREPDLAELWSSASVRLERNGERAEGRIRTPPLTSRARLVLESLLGRSVGATVDLALLEQALRRLEIGPDLPTALAALGAPVSSATAERRAASAASRATRAAARAAADSWDEPWSTAWIDDLIRSGLLAGLRSEAAVGLVTDVRSLLDRVGSQSSGRRGPTIGRKQLAAELFGSAHALDRGTRLERASTRALVQVLGGGAEREVWERAGVHLDLTSGATLTWALPLRGRAPAVQLVDAATSAGVPVHLTRFALGSEMVVSPSTPILVTENPHVVELAAEQQRSIAVICGNGNPSSTTQELLRLLMHSRADLRYHGDFDTSGLAICDRMRHMGVRPWAMDAVDYLEALGTAEQFNVSLPLEPSAPGPTTWDEALASAFDADRRVVHEERLLPALLNRWEQEHQSPGT